MQHQRLYAGTNPFSRLRVNPKDTQYVAEEADQLHVQFTLVASAEAEW